MTKIKKGDIVGRISYNKDIIFIANSYPDLFYAKLLVYRLERDYGFNYKKFHVILGQDNNISKILSDDKN